MKKIITILDDENNYQELKLLLINKSFLLESFPLSTSDNSIFNYAKTKDAVIIGIDIHNFNNKDLIQNIKQYVLDNQNKPILIYIKEKSTPRGYKLLGYNFSEEAIQIANKIRPYLSSNHILTSNLYLGTSQFKNLLSPNNSSINIDKLINLFQTSTLPLEYWNHKNRLRLIYTAIKLRNYSKTIKDDSWLCFYWKKYLIETNQEKLYNYTLIRFWIEIIYSLINKYNTFEELYQKNPQISNSNMVFEYYSKQKLFSQLAKNKFIKPDLV
tara:strand:+ start:25000 stop:25809 length:810 start_codon:yes stop_codon:yes gene_type:complete